LTSPAKKHSDDATRPASDSSLPSPTYKNHPSHCHHETHCQHETVYGPHRCLGGPVVHGLSKNPENPRGSRECREWDPPQPSGRHHGKGAQAKGVVALEKSKSTGSAVIGPRQEEGGGVGQCADDIIDGGRRV